MSGVEHMMCKWIGKFIFNGLWTERPYLTLVFIFLLFVGLDILIRGGAIHLMSHRDTA
jgi:hypothetical protein